MTYAAIRHMPKSIAVFFRAVRVDVFCHLTEPFGGQDLSAAESAHPFVHILRVRNHIARSLGQTGKIEVVLL